MITEQYGTIYIFDLSPQEWFNCGLAFCMMGIFTILNLQKVKRFSLTLLFFSFLPIVAYFSFNMIFLLGLVLLISPPIALITGIILAYSRKMEFNHNLISFILLWIALLGSLWSLAYPLLLASGE